MSEPLYVRTGKRVISPDVVNETRPATPEEEIQSLKEKIARKHNCKPEIVVINYYIQPHGHCNSPITPDDLEAKNEEPIPDGTSGAGRCDKP